MFIGEQISAFFKSIFTGLLALIVAAGNFFGWYIDVGGVHGSRAEYAYTFAFSTEKIQIDGILGYRDTIRVTMGKNEREGCQFILRQRYMDHLCAVTVSDFTGPDGAALKPKVYREHYIYVGAGAEKAEGTYPDALVPYANGTLMVMPRRTNQGFYIELRTDAQTPAGVYNATVTVTEESGKEALQAEVSLEVVDVTFPDAAYCETAVGIDWSSQFYALNGVQKGTAEGDALYKQYYDTLLDHKISAYGLPYDILDSRADEYMSDPRVKSFIVPFCWGDDALLQTYYNKVQSNPDWARKGYFYPIDEPGTAAAIASYYSITDRLARLCPGYNMVTPFSWKFTDGEEYDNLAIQNGRSNIICPQSDNYDKKGFAEAVAKRVADNGDRSWWYVCCNPTGDYCNMFIHQQGTRHRLLFWQQYQRNITGLLYWDSVYWDKANPWLNSATWGRDSSSGDGSWFYPGPAVGLNEPIPSLRLKNITDGIEDYDLLRMAEAKFGRGYCVKKAAQLSASLTSYTANPERIDNVRVSILRDLT